MHLTFLAASLCIDNISYGYLFSSSCLAFCSLCFCLTRAYCAHSDAVNVDVYIFGSLFVSHFLGLYEGNGIGAEGARHLSAVLSQCASLTSLNLFGKTYFLDSIFVVMCLFICMSCCYACE